MIYIQLEFEMVSEFVLFLILIKRKILETSVD